MIGCTLDKRQHVDSGRHGLQEVSLVILISFLLSLNEEILKLHSNCCIPPKVACS